MEFVGGTAASTRPQLDGDLTGCLGTVSRAASSKAEVPSVIRFTTRTRSSHERQPYANGVSARFPLAVVAGVQPFRAVTSHPACRLVDMSSHRENEPNQ